MFTIKDMIEAGHTSARMVRYWEDKGLLGTVERSDGGHRRYTSEQIDRARWIGNQRKATPYRDMVAREYDL